MMGDKTSPIRRQAALAARERLRVIIPMCMEAEQEARREDVLKILRGQKVSGGARRRARDEGRDDDYVPERRVRTRGGGGAGGEGDQDAAADKVKTGGKDKAEPEDDESHLRDLERQVAAARVLEANVGGALGDAELWLRGVDSGSGGGSGAGAGAGAGAGGDDDLSDDEGVELKGAVLGGCEACGEPDGKAIRVCANDPMHLCRRCMFGMVKVRLEVGSLSGMVRDAVSGSGLCPIHNLCACARLGQEEMVALFPSKYRADVGQELKTYLWLGEERGFLKNYPCSVQARCLDCACNRVVAPDESVPLDAAVVLGCTGCNSFSECLTCGTSGFDVAGLPHVPIANPTTGDPRMVALDVTGVHACKRLLTFVDIIRLVEDVPGNKSAASAPVTVSFCDEEAAAGGGGSGSSAQEQRFFDWAVAYCKPHILARVFEFAKLAPAQRVLDELLPTLPSRDLLRDFRTFCGSADFNKTMRVVRERYLDHLMDWVVYQKCPTCGFNAVKDDKCVHMTCCGKDKMWCYGCGQLMKAGRPHACGVSMMLEESAGPEALVAPYRAVDLLGLARVVWSMRHWLQWAGLARGVASLRYHPCLGKLWHLLGRRVFVGSFEKMWLGTVDAATRREVFGW